MARLILGHTTHNSIKVWLRASERWPAAFIELLDANDQSVAEKKVLTEPGEFFCAVVEFTHLQPNTAYRVKLSFAKARSANPDERIRDAYTEGRFITYPEPGTGAPFKFLFGSCNLHSLGIFEKPDKSWVRISQIAREDKASFMLHCGDQIYADVPFNPPTDIDHYRRKYLDAWEDCVPTRRVLTELPHYMILDDHEIANNFDRSMDARNRDMDALLRVAMKAYWEFQHSHNPNTANGSYEYHYKFNCSDAGFFVLDTRYHRDSSVGHMLNEKQETDLLRWISQNPQSLKFIVSSVPFVGEIIREGKDKWCDIAFSSQRERILQRIFDVGANNVVFLTGDMHSSYHATLDIRRDERSLRVHELMSSPINQITPKTKLGDVFHASLDRVLPSGLQIHSEIDPMSFYGDHSNVMLVSVVFEGQTPSVSYQIFRTTKNEIGPVGNF